MLVFFDFQEFENTEQSSLWFLFSKIPSGDIYIAPFSRKDFIDLHNNNLFGELVANKISPILEILKSKKQIELANGLRGQSIVRSGLLERHMASMRPRRWRF